MTDFKAAFVEWYDKYIAAGWWRATSLWANAIAIVIAVGPEGLNWALQNVDLISSALPTLSDGNKARLLLAANVLAFGLRIWQQKSVREATLTQAVKTGEVTSEPGTEEVSINVAKG